MSSVLACAKPRSVKAAKAALSMRARTGASRVAGGECSVLGRFTSRDLREAALGTSGEALVPSDSSLVELFTIPGYVISFPHRRSARCRKCRSVLVLLL